MSVDRVIRIGGVENYTTLRGIFNTQYPTIDSSLHVISAPQLKKNN